MLGCQDVPALFGDRVKRGAHAGVVRDRISEDPVLVVVAHAGPGSTITCAVDICFADASRDSYPCRRSCALTTDAGGRR